MAVEEGYDPRRETLVMETRTLWDPGLGSLTDADREWLARAVHEHPESAAKIGYERSHTGFTREITVTVADVERDLILETLKHCLGNRTHAANILGISIRTLRNKLNEYADEGQPIPPPGNGEMRGVAAA